MLYNKCQVFILLLVGARKKLREAPGPLYTITDYIRQYEASRMQITDTYSVPSVPTAHAHLSLAQCPLPDVLQLL